MKQFKITVVRRDWLAPTTVHRVSYVETGARAAWFRIRGLRATPRLLINLNVEII